MRRWINFVLCIAFASGIALAAQESAPPKTEKTELKAAEGEKKTAPAEKKPDALEDFEKQLQKELEGAPDRNPANTEQPSVLWQFVRTLITLAFLLAIFYGVFRLYKFRRELPQQNFSAITSIYEYPLGTNQRLQIVEIAGRLMVLGVSDSGIQLVSEITDKYTIDRIKLDCAEDVRQPRADFLTELSRKVKENLKERFGKKPPGNFAIPTAENPAESLEAQRQSSMERLRKLKSDKFNWREK